MRSAGSRHRAIPALLAVLLLAALVGATPAAAQLRVYAHGRLTPVTHVAPDPVAHAASSRRSHGVTRATSSMPPLVFGIYPGGAAGTVGPSGPVAPEDPTKRLAALQQLRAPGAPFVLHLYAGYTGPDGYTVDQQIGDQISAYTAAGFQVEIALCYRPADGGSPADASGFADFARSTVTQYAANPEVVALQVTNEANQGGAPNASDGYYAGAKDALIGGVIAAHSAAVATGDSQLKIGFNWAYANDAGQKAFWSYLGTHGGRSFTSALDWVGLDAYPGTWGPGISGSLAQGTASALTTAFTTLRGTYLPLAHIPFSVALHVSESGYPTGPGRTPAMQQTALQAAVATVAAGQAQFNISDYRWFDLRDADSSSSSFESQYGLMTDSYTPKPAFATYQGLVAQLGAPATRMSALSRLRHALRLR